MRLRRDSRHVARPGVTLVELLIATMVIGVLALIIARPIGQARDRVMTTAAKAELRNTMQAIEAYSNTYFQLPPSIDALAEVRYEVADDIQICQFDPVTGASLAAGYVDLQAQHVRAMRRVGTRYPGHTGFTEVAVSAVCDDVAQGTRTRVRRGWNR